MTVDMQRGLYALETLDEWPQRTLRDEELRMAREAATEIRCLIGIMQLDNPKLDEPLSPKDQMLHACRETIWSAAGRLSPAGEQMAVSYVTYSGDILPELDDVPSDELMMLSFDDRNAVAMLATRLLAERRAEDRPVTS